MQAGGHRFDPDTLHGQSFSAPWVPRFHFTAPLKRAKRYTGRLITALRLHCRARFSFGDHLSRGRSFDVVRCGAHEFIGRNADRQGRPPGPLLTDLVLDLTPRQQVASQLTPSLRHESAGSHAKQDSAGEGTGGTSPATGDVLERSQTGSAVGPAVPSLNLETRGNDPASARVRQRTRLLLSAKILAHQVQNMRTTLDEWCVASDHWQE